MNPLLRGALAGACTALALAAAPATLTVRVDQPAHRIPSTLWGIFFEDINLSADGGLYPELVRNRSFEDAAQPEHWTLVKSPSAATRMETDTQHPLTPLNRRSLRLELEGGASLLNDGYWGMNVLTGARYRASLAARVAGDFRGPLKIALEDSKGAILAQGEIQGLTETWREHALELTASGTAPKARLRLTAEGRGTLWLDMVSVLPVATWKQHGLRPDLAGMLEGLKPAFVRFPGGCWVEGDDLAHMYRWKETVGDVANRKPLGNIWGYQATHGLGFHEYLQLSEDLGAEPLFCINVGMSHRENVPLDQMGPWVQDALDALEYSNGPTNTVWGGLRARNGHPAPFHLKYLEIGNENGGSAYQERWPLFHDALKARYPEVQLIANVWGGFPTNRPPEIIDEHYYNNPEFFMAEAGHYDGYDRRGPKVFVGEYAVTQGCGQGNLRGALGEAAFMTGLERNSDVVVMASYAPLFVNVNHKRWNPDLINFDSARAYGIPSYYVQQMFAQHRGDVVLPLTLETPVAEAEPIRGAIGVGTWLTRAEFKDLRVTRGTQTLFAPDLAKGLEGWKLLGNGQWSVQDGVLRQESLAENVRAIVGDPGWTDYTFSLKARKMAGDEGFLILFGVEDPEAKSWWNLGGWGNHRHAVERGVIVGREAEGRIETGRWYDIQIEVSGRTIRCHLDGRLVHECTAPAVQALYASAARDDASGEVILKVVNTSVTPQPTDIRLQGVLRVASPAKAVVLTSPSGQDENSLDAPTRVSPVRQEVQVTGPIFQYAFPANSLTVLRLKPS
jgi:alpha-L-arabinofuranosidase